MKYLPACMHLFIARADSIRYLECFRQKQDFFKLNIPEISGSRAPALISIVTL